MYPQGMLYYYEKMLLKNKRDTICCVPLVLILELGNSHRLRRFDMNCLMFFCYQGVIHNSQVFHAE